MASGICSPRAPAGKPNPFQRSNVHQAVAHLAARREVVRCPLHRPRLQQLDDLRVLLGWDAGGGVRDDIGHHLGRIRGVVDKDLRTEGDLVAEDARHLVRVPRATDVAEQCDPVGGVAHIPTDAGLLSEPHGEQARPELRLQGLAERVVLREGERRDEFAQSERGKRNGETSRCARSGSAGTLEITRIPVHGTGIRPGEGITS